MNRLTVLSLTVVLAAAACAPERPGTPNVRTNAPEPPAAAAVDPAAHRAEIEQWKERRAERLQAEDGWLSLVGLHWLDEGENRFGSASGANDVTLPPTAPPHMGTIVLDGGKATLRPAVPMTIGGSAAGREVPLLSDADEGGPTVVRSGSMRFQVIRRGDRYGLRVKDENAPTRVNFHGLEYFPVDPKWRVEARFEPYDPPKIIPITDVTGMTADNRSPGALVFTIDGQLLRLDPVLEEGSDQLFIIFRDATSRDATYPAGRYLYAPMPGPDGIVVLDFNRAYNPPCAFTEFATCPLPPLQNRIPLRIEAGEKKYAGH